MSAALPHNAHRSPSAPHPLANRQAIRLADVLEPGLQGRWWQAVRQRDDWVLLALLRDRTTRRHFVAGTTHLYWWAGGCRPGLEWVG